MKQSGAALLFLCLCVVVIVDAGKDSFIPELANQLKSCDQPGPKLPPESKKPMTEPGKADEDSEPEQDPDANKDKGKL